MKKHLNLLLSFLLLFSSSLSLTSCKKGDGDAPAEDKFKVVEITSLDDAYDFYKNEFTVAFEDFMASGSEAAAELTEDGGGYSTIFFIADEAVATKGSTMGNVLHAISDSSSTTGTVDKSPNISNKENELIYTATYKPSTTSSTIYRVGFAKNATYTSFNFHQGTSSTMDIARTYIGKQGDYYYIFSGIYYAQVSQTSYFHRMLKFNRTSGEYKVGLYENSFLLNPPTPPTFESIFTSTPITLNR